MNAPEINELYDNQNHQKFVFFLMILIQPHFFEFLRVEFEEDSRVPNAGANFSVPFKDSFIFSKVPLKSTLKTIR